MGLSAEQASGWGWTAAVHPEDVNDLAATWQRIMVSEAPGEAEARLRRSDGEYRWFLFRANPLRDEKGNIVKWYGINTDIEDRKRAEDAVRKSERQFRLLVETIPALVWCATPEGELDYLNQRAVEYLGHTVQSLSGGRWLELVHPDQRDATVRRWLHSATTGWSDDESTSSGARTISIDGFSLLASLSMTPTAGSRIGTARSSTSTTESGPRRSSGRRTTVSPRPSD